MKYQNTFVYELNERVDQGGKKGAAYWRTAMCSSPKKALEIAIAWRTEMEANDFGYDISYRLHTVALDMTEGQTYSPVVLEGDVWVGLDSLVTASG